MERRIVSDFEEENTLIPKSLKIMACVFLGFVLLALLGVAWILGPLIWSFAR